MAVDTLEALIKTKKEIRSLDDQLRKTGDRKRKIALEYRKKLLEQRYQRMKELSNHRKQNAALELRKVMEARSRLFMSPGNGIETTAFMKGGKA